MFEVQTTENGELIVRISSQEAQQRGIKPGDRIEIVQYVSPEEAKAAGERVLQRHKETFEYLKDK